MKLTEFKLRKIIKNIIAESEIYKFDSNTPPDIRYDIAVEDCAKEYDKHPERYDYNITAACFNYYLKYMEKDLGKSEKDFCQDVMNKLDER